VVFIASGTQCRATVSTLVLVQTARGFLLVPRRGRGYAVSTMRTLRVRSEYYEDSS